MRLARDAFKNYGVDERIRKERGHRQTDLGRSTQTPDGTQQSMVKLMGIIQSLVWEDARTDLRLSRNALAVGAQVDEDTLLLSGRNAILAKCYEGKAQTLHSTCRGQLHRWRIDGMLYRLVMSLVECERSRVQPMAGHAGQKCRIDGYRNDQDLDSE